MNTQQSSFQLQYFKFEVTNDMLDDILTAMAAFMTVYHTASSRKFSAPKQTVLNNLDIYKQLQYIAESDYLSKILMNNSDKDPDITRRDADLCAARKQSFYRKNGIIDLLRVREAYSKHAAVELAKIWPVLHEIASRDAYISRLLNGLQLTITTHMTIFYRSYYWWYAPNLDIIKRAYTKNLRDNLEELYAVYRAGVAALSYSRGEIPDPVMKLSAQIIKQNAAQYVKRGDSFSSPHVQTSLSILDEYYVNRPYISPNVLPLFNEMIGALSDSNCEKCVLWLAIQLSGLVAAVKILNNKPLDKTELTCLIYAFRKASISIREVSRLMDPRFIILKLPLIYYFEPFLIIIGILYILYPYRAYLLDLS
ncbi:hypothetical protein PAPHI01_0212 [Pancytospora philotis]|nr:hypothetical protein PAPHI01_0212 [Pancytospora philotis]